MSADQIISLDLGEVLTVRAALEVNLWCTRTFRPECWEIIEWNEMMMARIDRELNSRGLGGMTASAVNA